MIAVAMLTADVAIAATEKIKKFTCESKVTREYSYDSSKNCDGPHVRLDCSRSTTSVKDTQYQCTDGTKKVNFICSTTYQTGWFTTPKTSCNCSTWFGANKPADCL